MTNQRRGGEGDQFIVKERVPDRGTNHGTQPPITVMRFADRGVLFIHHQIENLGSLVTPCENMGVTGFQATIAG